MKKLISTILMSLMLLAAIPVLSVTAAAQTRYCETNGRHKAKGHRKHRNHSNANYENGYNNRNYRAYNERRPNVYQRHRKAFNIGIGAGGGALLGALIGGRTGALIGAAAGAGGGYLVTKKQKPTNYYRFRR